MSRRRKWMLRLIAMSLPLLGVMCGELALRGAGFGGYPALFIEAGPAASGYVMRVNTDWSAQFFGGAVRESGTSLESAFVTPKPPGTFRVFLVGASFVRGWPHTPGLTSAAFLERGLEAAWPDRVVEVINLGTTAVASFPVLRMTMEALDQQPDLIVACTGHNEFFGAAGVASLHAGRSPGMIRLAHWTRSLALTQALSAAIRGEPKEQGDRAALIERMAAQSHIGPDDPLRAQAAENLATHLGQIVAACQARGVPLVLCTLPSNERDLAPVGEDPPTPVSEDQRARFDRFIAAAQAAQAALTSESATALEQLHQAAAIHANHAGLQYLLAQALEADGDARAAAHAYRRARDLDSMPWRATTRMNEAIRKIASDSSVPLADLEMCFDQHGVHPAAGWDLMDDHVHPSVRGQALVAYGIIQALAAAPEACRISQDKLDALGTLDDWVAASGDNPCERYRTAWLMKSLFGRPPLNRNNSTAIARFNQIMAQCLSEADPVVRETLEWWVQPAQEQIRQQSISGVAGKRCAQAGRLELAEPWLAMARQEAPRFSSGRLDYTLALLSCRGQIHSGLSDADRTLAQRELADGEALAVWDSPETAHLTSLFVGSLHHLLGNHDQAVHYLERARAQGGVRVRQRVDLALIQVHLARGHVDQAQQIINRARQDGAYTPAYAAMEQRLAQSRPAS